MVDQRVAYVDSLRCIAATAVLAQHLLELADPVRFAGFLDCAPGVFGVVLFFYISGFVIPISVRSHPPVASFLIRRLFRIYPAYLAALVFVALLAWVQREPDPFMRVGFFGSILNLLLLQEYFHVPAILGVTWTLSIEFVWYAVFAFIFYRARTTRISRLVLIFSLGMVLISFAALVLELRVPAGRFGLIGAALVGYLSWQTQTREPPLRREYLVAVTAFAGAMAFSLYVAFGVFSHPNIRLHHSLLPWAAATTLFLAAVHSKSLLRGILGWRPLVALGESSYSLYLVHAPIITLLMAVAGAQLTLLLTPGLVVAVAWLSYRWVELPGVRLGKSVERAWVDRAPSFGRASA